MKTFHLPQLLDKLKTIKIQSSLFVYNAFNVISDGIHAKAGTITSNEDWYLPWKTIDGIDIAPRTIPQLEV